MRFKNGFVVAMLTVLGINFIFGLLVAADSSKPNIIVIFTDDHGYADLGANGQVNDIKTPNLDRLASEGVRATSGYITAPQCVPSRAGIITGIYQQRFGVDHNGEGPLPVNIKTLPQRMKQVGYATGMVGKWHLTPNHSCRRWVEANLPNHEQLLKQKRFPIPAKKIKQYEPAAFGFDDYFYGPTSTVLANYNLSGETIEPKRFNHGMYRLDGQTEASLAFIRRHAGKQPFFLYFAYFAPHVPLEATEKYLSRFSKDMPRRRRIALAMLSAIDDGVGKISNELNTLGIDENTIIFFISDNGAPLKIDKKDLPGNGPGWDGSLNDPWVGEKGMLTEGGIRVPFVVRWKGKIPAGKVYRRPIISLDVAATALSVAGQAVPEALDGVNLIPYLRGEKKGDPHEYLYWRFWGQSAVRSGKWKYLYLNDGTRYLFDVESNLHEKQNLLNAHPDIANRLHGKLKDWSSGHMYPGITLYKSRFPGEKFYTHYLNWKPRVSK